MKRLLALYILTHLFSVGVGASGLRLVSRAPSEPPLQQSFRAPDRGGPSAAQPGGEIMRSFYSP